MTKNNKGLYKKQKKSIKNQRNFCSSTFFKVYGLYGLAKTHKFDNIEDITLQQLKFRPIIAQVGTSTYKAAQVIAEYLQPLVSANPHLITNTQQFPAMLKSQPPLQDDEEFVSYDVESLFTNVPVRETVDYIMDKIYKEEKLPIIATKLTFKRLLLKLLYREYFHVQR